MFEIIFGMIMLYLFGALAWSLCTAYPILFVIAVIAGAYFLISFLLENGSEFSALLFPVEGAGTGFIAGWIMRSLLGDENILYNWIDPDFVVPIIMIVGAAIGLFIMVLYVDSVNGKGLSGQAKSDCYGKYMVNTLLTSFGAEAVFGVLVLITTGALFLGGIVLVIFCCFTSWLFN